MIFIPYNVPSSKNSKVKTAKGVFNSRTVAKYLQKIGVRGYSRATGVKEYKTRDNVFRGCVGNYFEGIEYPVVLGIHFVRDTHRRFDFHNACQIILDLLVWHGFIRDDDMSSIIPVPMKMDGRWFSVDKRQPGVYLKIKCGSKLGELSG